MSMRCFLGPGSAAVRIFLRLPLQLVILSYSSPICKWKSESSHSDKLSLLEIICAS